MFNNLLVLPKSGVSVRRRRLVQIYGKEFPKPLGYVFAPIYHNWTYAFSPESILKMIEIQGAGNVKDSFKGVLMEEPTMKMFKLPFTPKKDPFAGLLGENMTAEAVRNQIVAQGAHDYDKEFVENILPRLDAGLKQMSAWGSIQFLLILLILGANLGFNTKFFYYIISNILTTEATSYVWQNAIADAEVSGNSIFGYTNYTMCFNLWWKKGFSSSIPLTFATFMGLMEFVAQFFVPAASKILHGWGIVIGFLWYYYGYGLK